MVKCIVAKEKVNCEHLLGTFLNESHYDTLIQEDTDCWMPNTLAGDSVGDESRIAFKFRKNFFTQQEQDWAYEGLREAAVESQNRGMAAGPRGDGLTTEGRQGRDWVTPYQIEVLEFLMDDRAKIFNDNSIEKIREKWANGGDKGSDETRGQVWMRSEVEKVYPEYHGWFDKWVDGLGNKSQEQIKEEATKIATKWASTTNYAKSVFSGIAGWFDRYPRIPYGRATTYTENQSDKFAKSFPFLQSLDRGFRELLPERWANQRAAADKLDPRFLVPETVFTTLTINKTFQTAAHRDAGDLDAGLSNLLALGSGQYTGGYLVVPEYRIAIDVRPGDLLLINNHECIHGNTPIVINDPTDPTHERVSIVVYFREKMLELKSWEYEQTRKQFVEDRRKNKDHEFWKPLWNGVSPGMWHSEEWRQYLMAKGMTDEDGFVNTNKQTTLEDFFS